MVSQNVVYERAGVDPNISYLTWSRGILKDSWGSKTYWQMQFEKVIEVPSDPVILCTDYWLMSMFSWRFLHILEHLTFYYVFEWLALIGSLLIATCTCLIFMLLINQEMLYSQANQKKCSVYWSDPQLCQLTYIIDLNSRSATFNINTLQETTFS